jgi:sec-independent protein translocase protein TatA
MGNVGGGEIVVILLAALLILGPNKLPDAARQLGRAIGELRRVTSGFQRELQDALKDTDTPARATPAASTPSSVPASSVPAPTEVAVPSAEGVGSEPVTDPVTMDEAAAQIPPAPVSDELSPAPGSDR